MALITFAIASCNDQGKLQSINGKGFLVLRDPHIWIFYPVSSLESNNCRLNLSTENLKTGIVVPIDELPDTTYSKVIRSMDTLNLMREIESDNGKIDYLLVCAVELEYQIDKKFVGVDSQLKSNFSVQTRNKTIEFVYNQFPVVLSNVSPIYCLDKKESDIIPYACERNQDPDDFLYKICEYLRGRNKYSELPDLYRIKKISMDTLDSKKVIKVELTCCSLGHTAYFDIKTKEIITIKFGAR